MSTQNNNNDIGNRIQQSVTEALTSGDFSRLNGEITTSVRDILNEVGDQINSAVSEARGMSSTSSRAGGMGTSADPRSRGFTNTYNTPYRDIAADDIARHQQRREELRQKQLQQRQEMMQKMRQPKVKFNEVGAVSGMLNIVSGSILSAIGFLFLVVPDNNWEKFAAVVMLTLGITAITRGNIKRKWLNLARQYKKLASEKMYVTVDTIAEATGTEQKDVIKNIKKILAKGFFPEGYIDETNTTLMVSQSVYEQYLETKRNQIVPADTPADVAVATDSELNTMIGEGMKYVDRLHELNDKIPGLVITQKLSKLEQLLGEIFDGLKEHPEEINSCRKLMDYYLPTMIKLVEAYAEYDKMSAPGEDIIEAKKEIENTLDIINQAFVELLNKLYQNSVWDVTAEAKVLKTMLHQAGLTEGKATVDSIEAEELVEEEEDLLDMSQLSIDENVVNRV